MTGIKVCATGSYVPDNIVDNEAFTKQIETSDEWIRSRTGIVSRNIANGDTTWSMGAKAAKRALETSGIDASAIDVVIATTCTPDWAFPSLSCVVQYEIGAVNAMCLDVNCACTGFVYALDMARRYLACGDMKNVLIVSSELLSRVVDYSDRATCILFGDGAGACVVQAGDGMFSSSLGADGSGYHLLFAKYPQQPSPFTQNPPVENEISRHDSPAMKIVQDGREVYKFATKAMPSAIEQACERAGISPQEIDYIIPHQANIRIVQTAMKHLDLSMDKVWMNIDHCGNTSSASIPIAFDELARSGRLKAGDKVCMVGFGAGLTWGAALFEY